MGEDDEEEEEVVGYLEARVMVEDGVEDVERGP